MLDVPFRSARQLAASVRKKEIGCLELLDLFLARVARHDGAINAVVVRDFDRARRRARAADRALARGEVWGPLHGVPITVKESYDVAGLPTTWGVPSLRDHILLCPVAGVAAFPHDQAGERHERTVVVNGRRMPVTDHLFWAGYTGVSFLPSSAAPCGFTPGGLPVGVQIAGSQYGDLTCLAFAKLLEREYQPFVPPPGYA